MTYETIKTTIANDINRTDLSAEISRAVQASIKFYENERFWFNETRAIAVTTDGTEYYDLPSSAVAIDSFTITINNNEYPLEAVGYLQIEQTYVPSTTYTGHPQIYALYDQKFRLYPIPDDSYTCRVSYVEQLSALSASSDANAWTETGAEEMIRYRAMGIVYKTKFHNIQLGEHWMNEAERVKFQLKRRTDGLTGSRKIKGDL